MQAKEEKKTIKGYSIVEKPIFDFDALERMSEPERFGALFELMGTL